MADRQLPEQLVVQVVLAGQGRQQAAAGATCAAAVDGVASARVEVTWDPPWDSAKLPGRLWPEQFPWPAQRDISGLFWTVGSRCVT